jgi:Domain of unknown function (DUF4926)
MSAVGTRPATAVESAEALHLHDFVEFPDGKQGTIVDVYPERETFVVEIADENGRTLDLVPVHRRDLTLVARVA